MKLPSDSVIARAKAANYLLQWRPENDKSQFLAIAGYAPGQVDRLLQDIRDQLLPLDAVFEETTEYGDKYCIRGTLTGPNGRRLRVVSVWLTEGATGTTKFITLHPAKED
jgi:hypothetical protein